MRGLLLAFALFLAAAPAAFAQTTTPVNPAMLQTGICPYGQTTCPIPATPTTPLQTLSVTFASAGSTTLSTSTTSANAALPANGSIVEIANGGSVTAYVNLGAGSGLLATTSNLAVPAGQTVFIYTPLGATYIAGITASSTASLTVTVGNPEPAAGSSGGGASNVAITSPLGTQAISASVAVTPATSSLFTTQGLGTAGSPLGGINSVQGVAGGTAIPVSGTFFQTTQNVQGPTADGGGSSNGVVLALLNAAASAQNGAQSAQGALGTNCTRCLASVHFSFLKGGTASALPNISDAAGDLYVAGPYAGSQTAITAHSGNVAASTAAATLTGTASTTVYISGFTCTGGGATLGSVVNITVTGLLGGTQTYNFAAVAGVLLADTPLSVVFNPAVPASAVNTTIVVSMPSLGTGNTNAACNAQGFYQ